MKFVTTHGTNILLCKYAYVNLKGEMKVYHLLCLYMSFGLYRSRYSIDCTRFYSTEKILSDSFYFQFSTCTVVSLMSNKIWLLGHIHRDDF